MHGGDKTDLNRKESAWGGWGLGGGGGLNRKEYAWGKTNPNRKECAWGKR